MPGKCDHCLKPFGLKHPEAKSWSKRFCSTTCKKAYKHAQRAARAQALAERRAVRGLFRHRFLIERR